MIARAVGLALVSMLLLAIILAVLDDNDTCPRGYDVVIFHTARGDVTACVDPEIDD